MGRERANHNREIKCFERLQNKTILHILSMPETPFIQDVSAVYTAFLFLHADLIMALRAL